MLFHSASFFVFFAIVLPIFAWLKGPARLWWTLVASHFFYAWWNPSYLILLWGLTLLGYALSFYAQRASPKRFALFIAVLIMPLCVFKYAGFLAGHWLKIPDWPLPLGISFITFTIIAYWMDIRRGQFTPQKDFGALALYISFFPHLIAGPIMRPRELFPQFTHLRLDPGRLKPGIFLFCIGLIKKVVFADTLSPLVSRAYEGGPPADALQALLAFYAFPVQIYCDFSGYTDMALGIALLLGVRLPLNFNRPYTALSLRDFWHRWHITLSRWLRDYLYIPLGGSRSGKQRMILALFLTMLIGGLWHGAAWTFVAWGAYHGILLIIERSAVFNRMAQGSRWPTFLRRLFVFHVVAVGWVLFRAGTWQRFTDLFGGFTRSTTDAWGASSMIAVALIALFFGIHRFDRVTLVCGLARRQNSAIVYAVCAVILILGAALSVGNPNAFIYFDF